MKDEFKEFMFPAYDDIVKANKPFLKNKSYRGYEINVPVTEALFLTIECQNESVVNKKTENVLRFAWCNHAGFAVAQVRYVNSEAGYLMGCAYLLQAADEIRKTFEYFIGKECHPLSEAIKKYENEHPELGGEE